MQGAGREVGARGLPTGKCPNWRRTPPLPCVAALLQRLLKDCEEKAEAARRPSTQQLAPAQAGAAAGQQRRASGAKTGGSSQEGDSDGTADGGEAAAAAAAPASGSDAGPAGDSAGQSSDDAEGEDGAANGAASEFVPNLDKLKKLGKRAGPGGKVTRHHADRVEEPKKKAPAGKKGKQARVWGDAANGKGERGCCCAACGLRGLPVRPL